MLNIYGTNLHGSVFRIVFGTFLREFESVETSLGYAQLLGEKLDFQNDVGKKLLNGESRNECCDFTKKILLDKWRRLV